MPARKRNRQEADLDSSVVAIEAPQHNPTLNKLRNMWQFSSFMQYLFLFGKVVKVDEDFDMDVSPDQLYSLCTLRDTMLMMNLRR